MKFFRNIFILIIILILSYFFSSYFGVLFDKFYKITEEGFFSVPRETSMLLIGFILSYIFFSILLFTLFGGAKKYWWIGILLIPAAAFELSLDAKHIYFPLVLALLGWLIGLAILKIYQFAKKRSFVRSP